MGRLEWETCWSQATKKKSRCGHSRSIGRTPIHRPGTLIGKALEPLDKGAGEILVLISFAIVLRIGLAAAGPTQMRRLIRPVS